MDCISSGYDNDPGFCLYTSPQKTFLNRGAVLKNTYMEIGE